MYEDELSRNIDHLSGLLTDDYVLIHMTGMHQSKETNYEKSSTF